MGPFRRLVAPDNVFVAGIDHRDRVAAKIGTALSAIAKNQPGAGRIKLLGVGVVARPSGPVGTLIEPTTARDTVSIIEIVYRHYWRCRALRPSRRD